MELTIEQALQQGIAAHKEGNIQEAERLYHAILQSQPAHADANHNLGVIAVSINKTELALSLFKTALEANPKVEQFWLSYIDTLIKETQFETAIAVLQQGKKMGLDEDKVDALEVQLTQITQLALPTQSQIDNLLEYYQKGQHKEAEKLAVFLTQQFSEYQFGWKVLGAVLSQTGRLLESLDAKQIAVQLAPLDAEAHSNLGITLLELRRLDEAEASYTQAIVLKPDYSEAHNNLGITLQELGRLEEAEASCRQAIEFKPDFAEAHNNLGNPLRESGRLEEAEAAYRQAIVLKPDYSEAHNNLGATLQELDRLEEAEASHRQAIAWKPDYAEAHSNLGIALQELDRLEEAETSFKQALALKPDYTEAHSNLGNTLQELGRLEEAEASYTQAIALKSDFPDAHYNLGNTLKMLGRLEKAEASYRKAIVLKPDYADSHYNLGITLQELGRLKEAEASYRRAIALQPDYAEAYSNLGVALKELGRLDEAEVSYRQAIVLKPDYPEAHSNLGNTLQELGRLDEAESSYRQAIACKPDYTDAFMNRWRLLFNKGDFEAALKDSEFCNTKVSRQHSLETLYALRRIEEVYKRIEMESQVDEGNITTAAFASFLAKIEKKDTANNFCKNPIDFIHFDNISSHLEDSNALITELIEELYDLKTVWEPTQKATKKGFQTPVHINLFGDPSLKMAHLKSIILDELDSYYLRFQNELCSFIQKWPCKKNLWGWHVILKHQGYQTAHIHPGGWLSGVIYLKVVPSLGEDEGAIEFSLNGENYSNVNSPSLTYQPKKGDIVFFPSSLHHRTIPFTTNTDRIIVSFDLIPDKLGGLI